MYRLVIIIVIFFSSCYSPRYVYSPVTQNIPMVSKKKDVQAGAFIAGGLSGYKNKGSKGAYNLGMDLHLAYAFTNHFAAMINQSNRWEQNGSNNDVFAGDSIVIKYKRSLTEAGGGYYSSFNNDNTCFQFFAGVALGTFNINESNARNRTTLGRFHHSSIEKIFIQPAIISGMTRNFTTAFSSRFSIVYFDKVTTDYSATELHDYFLSDLSGSPVFFWEPSMTYVFGFKHLHGVKFEGQLGFSVLMNRRFVDYRTMNIAFGVTSDLKWKRSPKTTAKPTNNQGIN